MKYILRNLAKRLVPRPIFQSVVRPAVRAILSLVYGRRGYKIDIGGQGVFRMSPDMAFRGWERFGDRHNWAFARCIGACKGESTFLDVGAHIGLYALPASRALAEGGTVFAFEPSRSSYGYLAKHIQYNGASNIRAYNVIVGDSDIPEVPFYEHLAPGSALSGITRRAKDAADNYVQTQLPQISLDRFCDDNDVVPDIIKIDTEGSELVILKGARGILARYRPLLFLSVHPAHLRSLGQSTEEVAALLADLGYEIKAERGDNATSLGSGEYICIPLKPPAEAQPANTSGKEA